MAYVNVKDWSVEQVMDWLKGLDNVILQYQVSFLNNGVTGHQLLNLRADDLDNLGVKQLGHQEIILEAVEHLRNFHYELDKENLQMLALKLSCAANSLYKELLLVDEKSDFVKTQVMSDVHNIVAAMKPLVLWLDRSPFTGDKDYIDHKRDLLMLSFDMAYIAHRGIFSENPVLTIKKICERLANIADHIIQDICDPMILQPASLDLATLKKKEQDLGFYIMPNYHPIHQIVDIKFGSPAHGSSKIQEGDEIVQINYQTVVGWQAKKVRLLLQVAAPEIVLTLKKRPRHSKVYGQIYMKPYRLPSRKKGNENWSKWNDNLPSPRLLPIQLSPLPITIKKSEEEKNRVEAELSSSDSEPPDSPLEGSFRMYPVKPRPILQRRNTITGTTPTNKRPFTSIEQYWDFIQSRASTNHAASSNHIDTSKFGEDSPFLRDKSASCNVGLDSSPRPTTVIGITHNHKKKSFKENFKGREKDNERKDNESARKKVNFDDNRHEMKSKADLGIKSENKVEVFDIKVQETNLNDEKSVSVNSLSSVTDETISFIDEGRDLTDRSNMVSDLVKETSISGSYPKIPHGTGKQQNASQGLLAKDPILAEINVHNMIKKFDDPKIMLPSKPRVMPRNQGRKLTEVPKKIEGVKPVVPPRSATTKLRGKLDKSHSTPAYDLTEEESAQLDSVPLKVERPHLDKLPDLIPKIPETITETSPILKESTDFLFKATDSTPSVIVEAFNNCLIEKEYGYKLSNSEKEQDEKSFDPKNSYFLNDVTEFSSPERIETLEKLDKDDLVENKVSPNNDLPPKPPPRKSLDTPKPVYPADSPKPVVILPDTPKSVHSTSSKKTFDFSDVPIDLKKMGSTQSIRSVDSEDYLIPIQVKHDYQNKGFGKLFFEPKSSSTPAGKYRMDYSEADGGGMFKSSASYDINKSSSESKVSPTNSIVKAMISNKGKLGKKKNNLIAKRRKVSVNDLSPADIQGYLHLRLRYRHTQNVHWEKRWFVLLGSCLYSYKKKEDPRAACLIFLSDFTVALASEVKSRSNAFKVYHTGTVFYFSAEDPDTLQLWFDLIRTACLNHEAMSKSPDGSLYSETDDSDTEKPKLNQTEKSDSLKKFGSLKKFSLKKPPSEATHTGSTSLDRKWFFNKSSTNAKSSSVPVPTAQFRSYRKIRNEPTHASVRTGNFTSHVPIFGPLNLTQAQNISVPNLTVDHISRNPIIDSPKSKPLNYVHASNPSLCNVSENSNSNSKSGTSKEKHEYKGGHDNLSGFVTLEELMNRQTEESMKNPHNEFEQMQINLNMIKPDVVYGEVPIRSKPRIVLSEEPPEVITPLLTRSSSQSDKHEATSSCFGKRLGSLKKNQKSDGAEAKMATYPKAVKGLESKSNRSLPRMLKMQDMSRECEEYTLSNLHFASDKNLSINFRKKSYEMIYCPETVNEIQFAQNRMLDDTMAQETPKKSGKIKRQTSFGCSDKKTSRSLPGFTSRVGDSSRGKLKSAIQYTPITLPMGADTKSTPTFAFELNLDEKHTKSSGKLTKIFAGKSDKKEKTFLGSPQLHRAIFRKQHSEPDGGWTSSPSQSICLSPSASSLEQSPPIPTQRYPIHIRPHADYPGLEYPPVFEPETYSLADPQSSLNLIRSKQRKENKENVDNQSNAGN